MAAFTFYFVNTRSSGMLFRLYDDYHDTVIEVIRKCLVSDDEEISKVGASALIEMHIQKGEFTDEFNDILTFTKVEADAIMYMLTLYFDIDPT